MRTLPGKRKVTQMREKIQAQLRRIEEEENIKRAYSYGIGFGGMAYKHIIKYKKIYPAILYLIIKISKNIFCIIYGIITINAKKIRYNYYSLKGKIVGILKSDNKKRKKERWKQ